MQLWGKRKQVQRSHEPGEAHEFTFSCYRRLPILLNDNRPMLVSRALDAALNRHECDLIAFVMMPEHLHLVVIPRVPNFSPSRFLAAIKRPVSYRIRLRMEACRDPLLGALLIRERRDKRCFRFWQEGGGYDRNLFGGTALEAATHYIHLNPVRRGLVEQPADWRWSSARYYERPDDPPDSALPRVAGFPY